MQNPEKREEDYRERENFKKILKIQVDEIILP